MSGGGGMHPRPRRSRLARADLDGVVLHGPKEAREVILEHEWANSPRKGKGYGDLRCPKFDVCLTTYETFTNCTEMFRKVPQWDYCVLDEAHKLKNKDAKALAALQSLQIGCKLALTGTPLQNNVGELWTMLDLLEPGKFGSQEAFNASYGGMDSAEQAQGLVEQLRPYLLRRTKDDVDLGILPMEETLISVEITNFQKQTYRALLEQNRSVLLHGSSGISGPSFNNLAMQLRHCCNHPFLIKGVQQAEGIVRCAAPRPTKRKPEPKQNHPRRASCRTAALCASRAPRRT
eukprot:2860258-Prymnesium_polylepis.1